ncbi:hypothetical protein Efla_003081 [Eimeria flavescens]
MSLKISALVQRWRPTFSFRRVGAPVPFFLANLCDEAAATVSSLMTCGGQRSLVTTIKEKEGERADPEVTGRTQGSSTSRGEAAEDLHVSRMIRRYAMLRPEDRWKLVQAHEEQCERSAQSWEDFRAQNVDDRLLSWDVAKRERQERSERLLRLREMYKPAHLRRRKQKVKRVQQLEEEAPAVVAANFTEEAQTLSLVEDIHKAEVYEHICSRVIFQWKDRDPLSDRFADIFAQAVREDLMDQGQWLHNVACSRPTLVNEFTDFDNSYMLKRQALKRLLEERGTRNALDESLIDKYLDRRPDLVKLRLAAKLPPEVVEPLAAFHGLTHYSFDKRTRLGQKVDAVGKAVDNAHCDMDTVLKHVPENQLSDMIHKNHPFRNHFGFVSAVPWGTVGSVSMGAEKPMIEKELERVRYPTLQRVAHSLPKDAKYRAIVAHALRVLERSRGWDFESKVKVSPGQDPQCTVGR